MAAPISRKQKTDGRDLLDRDVAMEMAAPPMRSVKRLPVSMGYLAPRALAQETRVLDSMDGPFETPYTCKGCARSRGQSPTNLANLDCHSGDSDRLLCMGLFTLAGRGGKTHQWPKP